jgi:hypothetical protein
VAHVGRNNTGAICGPRNPYRRPAVRAASDEGEKRVGKPAKERVIGVQPTKSPAAVLAGKDFVTAAIANVLSGSAFRANELHGGSSGDVRPSPATIFPGVRIFGIVKSPVFQPHGQACRNGGD